MLTGGRWRALLLVLAGLAAYWNSFSGPFVFDDIEAIVENQQIRSLRNVGDVLMPEREVPTAGRPLVNVSLAVNYAIGGLDVFGYHVFNLAVHLACALLLFGIVRLMLLLPALAPSFATRAADLAFTVALLWVLHPLNTETVNYVTQRTESMMALCFLTTMYASIRAVGATSATWAVLAVVACAAGMACKETMATAPVVAVLFDRGLVFGSFKAAIASRWRLYSGLAATWLLLAVLLSSGPHINSAGFSVGVSVWTYLLNQAVIVTRYIRLIVWPIDLVSNYGWPVALTLSDVWPQALFLVVLLLAALVAVIVNSPIGVAGAWFFITLAPASSIVPILTEVGAERRMYVPLMAAVALIVIGTTALWDMGGRRFSPADAATRG